MQTRIDRRFVELKGQGRAGLITFLELARDVGELDEVPELRFVTAAGATV